MNGQKECTNVLIIVVYLEIMHIYVNGVKKI